MPHFYLLKADYKGQFMLGVFLRTIYNHIMSILQLLQSGGSTQAAGIFMSVTCKLPFLVGTGVNLIASMPYGLCTTPATLDGKYEIQRAELVICCKSR